MACARLGSSPAAGNKNLAEIVGRHPDKFIGFAHHYLFSEGAADELRRAVKEDGLKAYKLLAPALDRPVEDEEAYPVWEACAELDIPVLIHFGIQGSGGGIAWHQNINPLKLHNVAKDFPMLPLSCRISAAPGSARRCNCVGLAAMCRLTPAGRING